MAHFALPQPILLWTGAEIAYAIKQRTICEYALEKYRICVELGVVDHEIVVPE